MDKMLSLRAIVSNETDKTTGQATIYLMNEETKTLLPISVDMHSAESILLAEQNVILPRPHTHDLIKRLVHSLGGRLSDVIIYDLQDDIFYAYIRVLRESVLLEIDARPSDAIALALRFSVPILAKEDVLTRGGVKISENTDIHSNS